MMKTTDLDLSRDLLCTMSPKFKCTKVKRKVKSPHKLSLKTNIRRSSIYDKIPHSHHVRDSSIIVLDDSTINEKLSPSNVKILKSPIIISSTSESNCSDAENVKPFISVQPKYIDIDNWLSENEKVDGYKEVYSFKNNFLSESDEEKLSHNDKNINKTTTENSPCGTWQVTNIQSNFGEELLRTPVSNRNNEDEDFKFKDSDIIESSDNEQYTFAENILDDLYGNSWRINQDKILTRSEPRKKQNRSPIRMPKTEKKAKQNSKEKSKYFWQQRLKSLCDSDTEESIKSDKSTGNLSKLSSSDSEDENDTNYNKSSPVSISKITNKKTINDIFNYSRNSSHSSDKINFSDSENDSLGTRVRKMLAKKAKTLYTDKPDQKKTDLEIKKSKDISKNKTVKKTNHVLKSQLSENAIIENKNEKFSFLKSLSGGIPPWKCHTLAQFFKTNYKTEKSTLAKKLFDLYNEKIFGKAIPDDTPLQWNDRMRGTAGFCYNRRITNRNGIVTKSCRIALSTKVLDTADRLRDTLVHEMCHAATWLVNNVADGHGNYWKSWAYKAMKTFPELPPIKRCHDYQINTKYTYKCINCGYSIGRHSKSLDIERKRCGYCYGKFEIFINKTSKNGTKQTVPVTPKEKLTGFALYVKENYSSVKQDNMKHAEVMKVLGQEFAKLKVNKK